MQYRIYQFACLLIFLSMPAYAQTTAVYKCEIENYTRTASYPEQVAEDYNTGKTTTDKYIIPVVFHIYDTAFPGNRVTDSTVKVALQWMNEDFNGLNPGYTDVHTKFKSIRGTLNIEFRLAGLDPKGAPTNGIIFHTHKRSGFALSTPIIKGRIAADAWDNYRYMNIYIMPDPWNDGGNGIGGSASPQTYYFDEGVARIAYRGAYLGPNTSRHLASILTHEAGHFFGLRHTFDGGCTDSNDLIYDTPAANEKDTCHASRIANGPLNCKKELINVENFMSYCHTCQKMFSKGQVEKMTESLNRMPLAALWADTTLRKSGVLGVQDLVAGTAVYCLHPNPTEGKISFTIKTTEVGQCRVYITDIAGRVVYNRDEELHKGEHAFNADISGQPKGIYLLHVRSPGSQKVLKIHLQ